MKSKVMQKVIDLVASILILGALLYIYGQYGSLECNLISTKEFVFNTGAGLGVLGTGMLLSNYQPKEGGERIGDANCNTGR